MSTQSRTIEITHGQGTPQYAIIWLHGLGATSDDFVPVVPMLELPPALNVRFIFPQAPSRPITVNGGMVMPGWYDIKGMDIADKEDLHGMRDSQAILEKHIDDQAAKGISTRNTIVAGFSQGGAVAYYTAIRSSHKLAGILALSTYLPFAQQAQAEQSESNHDTPILATHGQFDPVVPIGLGKQSAEMLNQLGYQVEWQEYPMQHNVIPEQLVHIGEWIARVLKH